MDLELEPLLLRIRAEPAAAERRAELGRRLAVTHPEHAPPVSALTYGQSTTR